MVQDLYLGVDGQPGEHVRQFVKLFEIKLPQILSILFFDEGVYTGRHKLAHVEVVRLEEGLEGL